MSSSDRSIGSSDSIPSFKRRNTMYIPDHVSSGEVKSEEEGDVKVRCFFSSRERRDDTKLKTLFLSAHDSFTDCIHETFVEHIKESEYEHESMDG